MKLLPLTSETRTQLSQEGFTHVILKNIVAARDRHFPTGKELYLYEAVKPNDAKLNNYLSDELNSEQINELLKKQEGDLYISVKTK